MLNMVLGTPVASQVCSSPLLIPDYLDVIPESDDLWNRLQWQADVFQQVLPLCQIAPKATRREQENAE